MLPLLIVTLVPLLSSFVSISRADDDHSPSASSRKVIVGGWTPIKNVSDPHVREIAEFAISEHNYEAKASLTLSKVVKGATQAVAGIDYKLVLKATEYGCSGVSANYEAVVWEKAWEHFMQLTSFKRCA